MLQPTEEDLKWLARQIRNAFDTPAEVYELDKDINLVEMAKRFGLEKLAEEMDTDIMYAAKNKNNPVMEVEMPDVLNKKETAATVPHE